MEATSLRAKNSRKRLKSNDINLMKLQAIASIAASVAIPLVLAFFGFMVQRQLASEGLKKDYVQIATSILKENPANQDKELRRWAVEVLDRNADIPFSEGAKNSLEKGFPIVRNQFFFPDAPKDCMIPSKGPQLLQLIQATKKDGYFEIGDSKKFLLQVLDEAGKATDTALKLECLQGWVRDIKKITEKSNEKAYGLDGGLKNQ